MPHNNTSHDDEEPNQSVVGGGLSSGGGGGGGRTQDRTCQPGFIFDNLLGRCVPAPVRDPTPIPETFRDPRTGNIVGVDLGTENPNAPPGGPVVRRVDTETGEELPLGNIAQPRTFLGLNRDQIEEIAGRQALRRTDAAGTRALGTAQAEAVDLRRKARIANEVGVIDLDTASQLEEQGINVKEVIAAGLQGVNLQAALAAGAAGATAGATAGVVAAIPTGGLSVPALTIGGAVVGVTTTIAIDLFNDVRRNIKEQRQDLVSTKTRELSGRRQAMNNYISAANRNPAAAEEYVAAYNIEKSLVLRDYNTLVLRGDKDLVFWGSDATIEIARYDVFFESVQPSLDAKMAQAVAAPDPTRAFLDLNPEEAT